MTSPKSDKFFCHYKSEKFISFDYFGDGQTPEFGVEDVKDLIQIINSQNGHCFFSKLYLGVYSQDVKELLQLCSPSIKELRLAHWHYRDSQFFPKEIPQPLHFKKLRKLSIKLVADDGDKYDVKKFFQFITEIFKSTSSLEELFCNFPGFWDGEAVEELLRSLVTSEISLNSLYKLELSGCLIPTQLLILGALENFHLTQLNLGLRGFLLNPGEKYLKRFLQSQSRSLGSLTIEDVDSTTKCVISFPKMEKLKKLCITGSKIFGETGIQFEDVDYFKQFPVLQDLTLTRVGQNEWKDFVENPENKCDTLKRLKISDSDLDVQVFDKKVKFLFPNLKAFVFPKLNK